MEQLEKLDIYPVILLTNYIQRVNKQPLAGRYPIIPGRLGYNDVHIDR